MRIIATRQWSPKENVYIHKGVTTKHPNPCTLGASIYSVPQLVVDTLLFFRMGQYLEGWCCKGRNIAREEHNYTCK